MRILVVNAGSSSVKVRDVGDHDATRTRVDLPALSSDPASIDALRRAIIDAGTVDAVGHRVVHGGIDYGDAVLVDDPVVDRLTATADLAPLHQPAALDAMRVARAALPDVPHVACFDTAFHASIPEAAATYALPRAWRERWPLRRFGFHGLSHAYVSRRAAVLLGRPLEELRLVTAHLGAGASLAAVKSGRSVDTTMGFTPLEGLVMATRSGSVDPGLLLWLQTHAGQSAEDVAAGLEHESGIKGLAGTADFREVLRSADGGADDARLAVGVYVHRLRAGIASMAAAMGGIDALVFTGGVGENAATIRAHAVGGLAFLGLGIDTERNERGIGDRQIGRRGDTAAVAVIESREELEIARQVRATLGASAGRI